MADQSWNQFAIFVGEAGEIKPMFLFLLTPIQFCELQFPFAIGQTCAQTFNFNRCPLLRSSKAYISWAGITTDILMNKCVVVLRPGFLNSVFEFRFWHRSRIVLGCKNRSNWERRAVSLSAEASSVRLILSHPSKNVVKSQPTLNEACLFAHSNFFALPR